MNHQLKFRVLSERIAVCRFDADAQIPSWATECSFFSVTRTADELSIVCEEARVSEGAKAECGWTALRLEGPFPFAMTGVLASFIRPLAEHKIPIFAIATFDTDYVLIKRENLDATVQALREAGHELSNTD